MAERSFVYMTATGRHIALYKMKNLRFAISILMKNHPTDGQFLLM